MEKASDDSTLYGEFQVVLEPRFCPRGNQFRLPMPVGGCHGESQSYQQAVSDLFFEIPEKYQCHARVTSNTVTYIPTCVVN